MGVSRKVDRFGEKMEEIGELVGELSEKVEARSGGGGGRVDDDGESAKLKSELEEMKATVAELSKELRSTYESTVGETGGLRQVIARLEKDINELKERPTTAAPNAFQQVQASEQTRPMSPERLPTPTPRSKIASRPPPKAATRPVPATEPTKAGKGMACENCRKRHRKCIHVPSGQSATQSKQKAVKKTSAAKSEIQQPTAPTAPVTRTTRQNATPVTSAWAPSVQMPVLGHVPGFL